LDKKTTEEQISRFNVLTQHFPGYKSIANSAGLLAWRRQLFPASKTDWVRPGLILYGVSPFSDQTAEQQDFQPVMTLKSKLIAINQLRRGDAVGYGGISVCPEDMPVGVISFGYGAGYPRHAPPGTPVLINNTLCPIIGRVSMQMITVDLRPCLQAQVGDIATLWGKGLACETIAAQANTIPYELLCKTSPYIPVCS
jgi:alanine racemase